MTGVVADDFEDAINVYEEVRMSVPAKNIVITQGGPVEAVPVASESAAIISMIERAARDPAVDVDKLRQLMEMRAQTETREAERAFDAAMTAAQTEMRPVAADSNNPQTRSRYASYPALDRAMRPIYTRNGFGLSFNTGEGAPENFVRVICDVSHARGHKRRYQIDMPADGKGAKGGDVMTKTHATGSAVSYGMRYLLKMIFNISVGDDDGNQASDTGEVISPAQAHELANLIQKAGVPISKFLTAYRIESVSDLRASLFNEAKARLVKAGQSK